MVIDKIVKVGEIPKEDVLSREVYVNNKIPTKFLFLLDGAMLWNRLRGAKEYRLSRKEGKSLEESLSLFSNEINEKINIIHVGPGNGVEIPIIFKYFKNKIRSYNLVDISETFLKLSVENNKEIFNNITHRLFLSDIEQKFNLKDICKNLIGEKERNLILITNSGSMLSNKNVFNILHDSLRNDDLLFLNFEGYSDNHSEILSSYKSKTLEKMILTCLDRIKFDKNNYKFVTNFDTKNNVAEVFFVNSDKNILCISSIKPKKNEFKKMLGDYGFFIEKYVFSNDSMISILCRRS